MSVRVKIDRIRTGQILLTILGMAFPSEKYGLGVGKRELWDRITCARAIPLLETSTLFYLGS